VAAAVVVAVMTAASIPASTASGYADYLQSRTVAPEQGDYYLGRDGAPTEAAGQWLTDPRALSQVGVTATDLVAADDLRALMAGREAGRPADEAEWIRPAGADGSRAGGLDSVARRCARRSRRRTPARWQKRWAISATGSR
jgi:hypothetical protein